MSLKVLEIWQLEKELELFLISEMFDSNGRPIERRIRIGSVDSYQLIIRANEQPPPHFHVISGKINASFSIEPCKLIKGSIDSKTEKKVLNFYRNYKDDIIFHWNNSRPTDCPVGPIKLN